MTCTIVLRWCEPNGSKDDAEIPTSTRVAMIVTTKQSLPLIQLQYTVLHGDLHCTARSAHSTILTVQYSYLYCIVLYYYSTTTDHKDLTTYSFTSVEQRGTRGTFNLYCFTICLL
jgi:hypothetical protein